MPVVRVTDIGGHSRLYFHDERLHELREVRNPHRHIALHVLYPALLAGLVTWEQVEPEPEGEPMA